MIFDYHMGNLMRKQLSMIVRLSFLTALLSFVSSCSIPTITKASSSEGISTVSSSESFEAETETTEEYSLYDEIIEIGDEYMKVLTSGDLVATCEKFSYTKKEMLPATFDFDNDIYQLIYTNMTYFFGGVIQKAERDFELSVTCYVPDLQNCVKTVRQDETFMYEVAEPWIVAVVNNDQTQLAPSYETMNEKVLKEAMRRIDMGEYTQKTMFISVFKFHQNIENWNCMGYPEFANFMSKDSYMKKLGEMQTSEAFDLIELFGPQLIQEGKIQEEQYNETLEGLGLLLEEAP